MSKDQSKKGLARVNTAKKVWYRIVGPKSFGQMELGETYLMTPEGAIGRTVKINLKDLTGNVKDQNAYVVFTVNSLEGTTLHASVSGYELTATSVKRMVRKNTNRLDDYFVFKTNDGKNVVIKTLLITQSKAQRSVQKQLRMKMKAMLAEEVNKNSFEALIGNLVTRKVQMTLKKALYKIYPVNEAAIRVLMFAKSTAVEMEVQAEEKHAPAEEASDNMEELQEEDQDEMLPEAA